MTSSVVHLTDDAARDLEEICDYIARYDSPGRAEHVLERIEESFNRLSEHPRRGSYPKELLDIGIREYREVFFKPYRIIYRVVGNDLRLLSPRRSANAISVQTTELGQGRRPAIWTDRISIQSPRTRSRMTLSRQGQGMVVRVLFFPKSSTNAPSERSWTSNGARAGTVRSIITRAEAE